ncbi:MAG: hypothetical protein CMF38_04150 [Legionellaceae bacterium]|nr:hypothetical protein [Legionellaceae bacterium]|tara:strand:+ start:2491 stop:2709 length:219 start_codon:yes stop_codon:yes gene_type:complete
MNNNPDISTRYIPVPNWEKHHDWPRIGGLRNLIFNRDKNGFDKFGVVKKVGKRVLIDEAAFFEWVANQGKGV